MKKVTRQCFIMKGENMMESKIGVTRISDNIWQFNEANENGPYVDAYLIMGTERALVGGPGTM